EDRPRRHRRGGVRGAAAHSPQPLDRTPRRRPSPAHSEETPAPMTAHPPIPADLARSWILVPPMHRPQLEAAHASGADVVVYDLEDGTEAANKKTARAIDAERLPPQPGWGRVNPAD